MRRLIIIGAGGFGREVFTWALHAHESGMESPPIGFLDDNPRALDGYDVGAPILDTIASYKPGRHDVFLCAIAKPAQKRRCAEHIESRGGVFTRLIHPSVIIGDRVQLEPGVILCPRVTLTSDIFVGRHSALNINASVGHDAHIGNFCQMHAFSEACGNVHLEDEVLVGTHASVLPGRRVGQGAVVGAGSIAFADVPAGRTLAGVSARTL